ncbi:MAG: spore coat U domain-containing protein [Methylobacter sp.]|uniref:Spore coat U domain-containing protein n=1 Tax=Candidatus Methylobacter titanis TaxID=3053457 RepID=A0AA43Q7F2_9GAMM|nr:spore coat U domain-containing protein [Candidatus Methylobacter titanis]
MKLLKVGITLAVALLAANEQTAQAATTSTTFLVSATVTNGCIVVATPLAFGVYDPSAAANDKTSTITVTCTLATPYSIGLNAGVAAGATVTTRQMKHATLTDLINYSLYNESTRTTNWDDTGGAGVVAVASATGLPEVHTVYGRIAAGQYVTAGTYADTITVTVTY